MTDTNHIEVLRDLLARYRSQLGNTSGYDRALIDRAAAAITALSARASAGEGGDAILSGLLDYIDAETCTHEETHRGGAIWTICDGCDRKWADDEGGFVPHEDAPAVAAARKYLAAAPQPAQAGASGGGYCEAHGKAATESLVKYACGCSVHESGDGRNTIATPASPATGQVAAGCAHVWVPGQAGMMYCDQCGRQKPAATPQPAQTQGDGNDELFGEVRFPAKGGPWGYGA